MKTLNCRLGLIALRTTFVSAQASPRRAMPPAPRAPSLPSPLRTKLIALLLIGVGYGTPGIPPQASGQPATSLHLAALQGDLEAVRQHIDAGSDLNAKDAYGSSPLTIAATFGRTEVARALLEAGADMRVGNNEGSMPLHIAAFFGHTQIVEALLNHGADVHARNNDGATAFDFVAAPFDDDRPLYDQLGAALRPLGLELEYDQIRRARPELAALLRSRARGLEAVDYAPLPGDDWVVSTPAEEGLDPSLVAELYLDAAALERIYGLLVIKNGHLIAERYFNGGAVEQKALLQSVTKSYTSALVGLALEQGCLSSVDQKLLDFFPEYAGRVTDPRKRQITIRDMLQMRAGYPWEETDSTLWAAILTGDYLPLIVDFPLTSDPGTEFQYSNVTSHWLGVIVARACDTDLKSFAREHLFSPLGVEVGPWLQDPYGYYFGQAEIHFTARDAARFGLVYLNEGAYEGHRVVPAAWVQVSLRRYSENVNSAGIRDGRVGRYFRDVGYGYQWWSARVGDHRFNLAWGHGGQLIILLEELDMVVVVTSDPFHIQHDDESWRHEQANLNLVGKFIQALPKQ